MSSTLKGPGPSQSHDGAGLRIAIVHARWNTQIIDALVEGTKQSLRVAGVKDENILIQDVPGSYELPFAVQRVYDASKTEAANTPSETTSAVTDLLTPASLTELTMPQPAGTGPQEGPQSSLSKPSKPLRTPFDAIIAIGVLIKGETMHFEYIAEATSQGLMRVQLDLGVPVIFGLLTVLNEDQAQARAGIRPGSHCHGKDWGQAAVELAVKRRAWGVGSFL